MNKIIIEITNQERLYIMDALRTAINPYQNLAAKILTDFREVPEDHAVEILPEHKQGEIDK